MKIKNMEEVQQAIWQTIMSFFDFPTQYMGFEILEFNRFSFFNSFVQKVSNLVDFRLKIFYKESKQKTSQISKLILRKNYGFFISQYKINVLNI